MQQPHEYRFDPSVSSVVGVDTATRPFSVPDAHPLTPDMLDRMHRYWQASNYLTIGQIYLRENPLLREPLTVDHIKPRLLGHWGTSPGLNLIYVHANRLINEHDVNAVYLAGPGHGGPALVAQTYLEGTYSEIYPDIDQSTDGMRRLFRQFSSPGGIPSHVSVTTPGSIHEGGELGYVLTHAFGAAFDNPDLLVIAVVGDGEAETGALAASWKSTSFLNPARDGAVLPILHLNGYKIGNPTVMGRSSNEDVRQTIEGQGYDVFFVEGDQPEIVHQAFAATLDTCYAKIRAIQDDARTNGVHDRPHWPAIVLRTPKGWTGPTVIDGLPAEGTFRSHQVPLSTVRENPEHLERLETWLRTYNPDSLFDDQGRLNPELAALAPHGTRRMSANPHANGGPDRPDLKLPDFRHYGVDHSTSGSGSVSVGNTMPLGTWLRDVYALNRTEANFRLFSPDELASNRLGAVLDGENRCFVGPILDIDESLAVDGRVMEVLSEHLCEGWLEGYNLTGRHGMYVTYEAFAMVSASMTVQHAKWLQESTRLAWRKPVPSLNILLSSTCWRNDHNGFSHQGPGMIDVMLSKRGDVSRIYLPPDANCLLSVADHCLRSRNYVNLIVADKQPHLQYLDMEAAAQHCAAGASVWEWAGNETDTTPDIVLACAGDVPTLETMAAAEWLQQRIPDLRLRVVNVVDLMVLFPRDQHPHGMDTARFVELFTAEQPVIFAFHGYQRAIHEIIHGHINTGRFHVRGFSEQGTTTTPFNMVVLNEMSRYHLCIDALRRCHRFLPEATSIIQELETLISEATAYAYQHFEDPPGRAAPRPDPFPVFSTNLQPRRVLSSKGPAPVP
ncbi:MAG: phosphoketolase family protein [Thermomicrobiales bacterium]